MSLELPGRPRHQPPLGLSLSLLTKDEDLSAFSEIVVSSLFAEKGECAPHFARVLASLGRDRCFGILGRAGARAVSTAFGFIDSSGIGGVYFVATLPEMRGRGYGAATVDAILGEFERRGAVFCILHATALGHPVYERLGFVDECRLPVYALP
jgi:GNAT superfamily N-acetyltransferase